MAIDEENPEEQLNQFITEFTQKVMTKVEEKLLNQIKPMQKEEKIMSAQDVCTYFKISQTTLERRVRAGLKYSQAVKKGNRLFKLTDCKKFFNIIK